MALGIELKAGLTRPDPLLLFRWVSGPVPFGTALGDANKVTPDYIETFELPFNNVKAEGTFFGGGYNYFPAFHDVSAFNVTFYGDSAGKTINWLMYWKSRVKNFDTGIYNLPGQYKRNWTVYLLDPTGKAVVEATLNGCWPADTGQLSLDYNDGSGHITFNQNFSTDSSSYKAL